MSHNTTCVTWTDSEKSALHGAALGDEAVVDTIKRLTLIGLAWPVTTNDTPRRTGFPACLHGRRGKNVTMTRPDGAGYVVVACDHEPLPPGGDSDQLPPESINGDPDHDLPIVYAAWHNLTEQNADLRMRAEDAEDKASAYRRDLDQANALLETYRDQTAETHGVTLPLPGPAQRLRSVPQQEDPNTAQVRQVQQRMENAAGTLTLPDVRVNLLPTITVDEGTNVTIHVTAPVVVQPR